MRSWSVVVPAKRLAVAKTRLRPLTEALAVAHGELVLALLADTVSAALACPAVGEVVVVTDDPAAADVVRALGARTVADTPDRGLNPALEHGARSAAGPAVAALSSDLPALRPVELAAALDAAGVVHTGYRTLPEALADPRMVSGNPVFAQTADNPSGFAYPAAGAFGTLQGEPRGTPRPAPHNGEHSEAVLAERLGLGQSEIATLIDAGLVGISG